jgi:hypothetical protein
MAKRKITDVEHQRGGPYLLKLECGHTIRRPYSQGPPKSMAVRCKECPGEGNAEQKPGTSPLIRWVGWFAIIMIAIAFIKGAAQHSLTIGTKGFGVPLVMGLGILGLWRLLR